MTHSWSLSLSFYEVSVKTKTYWVRTVLPQSRSPISQKFFAQKKVQDTRYKVPPSAHHDVVVHDPGSPDIVSGFKPALQQGKDDGARHQQKDKLENLEIAGN